MISHDSEFYYLISPGCYTMCLGKPGTFEYGVKGSLKYIGGYSERLSSVQPVEFGHLKSVHPAIV